MPRAAVLPGDFTAIPQHSIRRSHLPPTTSHRPHPWGRSPAAAGLADGRTHPSVRLWIGWCRT